MSTQMVQFNHGGMPANISAMFGGMVAVDDLTGGAESAFPILSIKGRVFHIKHGGAERMIQHGGQPLFAIDVVLVKANKSLSKLYYAKAYADGDDDPPSCSSANGHTPDAGVPAPQAPTCAACPHNVWGSKITPQGTKTKACADMRRIALLPEKDLECKTYGAPMLLRIPAASLQGLSEYARTILGGKPYSAVVTRISFDLKVAYPKLTFAPVRWLEANELQHVMRWLNDPIVGRIVGTDADPSAPNTQVTATVTPLPLKSEVVVQMPTPAPQRPAPMRPLDQVWAETVERPVSVAPVVPTPVPAPVVVDPLVGVPEYLKPAIIAVGGPETDAGKAIMATIPAGAVAAEPKRTRRTRAEMAAAAPAPTPPVVVAAPAVVAPVPAPVMAAPVPTVLPAAAEGSLLAGVDELLNGLDALNFDD